jgi:pimeloyl-ACP methyl ester carboxylesterase
MPASTPAIRDESGAVVPNSIASVESIELNGVTQSLVIRGRDQSYPVLLYLHGGPGTPETAPLITYDGALEDDFVVVSWDQRGAGKSYPAGLADPSAVTPARLLADTHALTTYLKQRFGQERIYLVGHSWATVLAMRAVQAWPNDYAALVSIEQTSDAVREERTMHAWVLDQAQRDGNQDAIRELTALNPGSLSISERLVRLKWIEHYGGGVIHRPGGLDELTWVVIRSPEYTVPEKLSYQQATEFTLDHLFPDGKVPAIDLKTEIPAVDVPVWFVEGRFDELVPMSVAHDYFDALRAPSKEFVVFESSAHSPPFEEPGRFCNLMREVLNRTGRALQ